MDLAIIPLSSLHTDVVFATDGVYPVCRLFRMDSFQQMCSGVPPADVILSSDPVEIVSPADVFRCSSSRYY